MNSKNLTLFLSLLLFPFFLCAQEINLTSLSDMTSARGAISSAQHDQKIYVANGFGIDEQYTSEILQYDIQSDTWSVLTANTIAKRFASAAVANGKLYVFNGQIAGGGLNNKMEVISLADGSVSFSTDNPQPCRAAGVSTWNGKIYSFGGALTPGVYSDKLYEFDPQTELWTELASMPEGIETKGEVVNGKLYILGGYNGATSDRIEVYNIATDTWENNFWTMPLAISANATAIVDSKIFLVGDFSNLNLLASFDTENQDFAYYTSNLISRRNCGAEGVDGKLYAMGGNTASDVNTSVSSLQVADIITSTTQINDKTKIDLFPNPASHQLTWHKDFEMVIITNTVGMPMDIVSENQKTLDIQNYPPGTYILIGKIGTIWHRTAWVKL